MPSWRGGAYVYSDAVHKVNNSLMLNVKQQGYPFMPLCMVFPICNYSLFYDTEWHIFFTLEKQFIFHVLKISFNLSVSVYMWKFGMQADGMKKKKKHFENQIDIFWLMSYINRMLNAKIFFILIMLDFKQNISILFCKFSFFSLRNEEYAYMNRIFFLTVYSLNKAY